MDSHLIERYREIRAKHPLLGALSTLRWAKGADPSDMWEESGHNVWTRTANVDGFEIRLTIDNESIFPVPNSKGETDYGHYVEEVRTERNWRWSYDWSGNWPRPFEDAPLGIPYTSIRYSGPGWSQGEEGGYFIPNEIEEQFAYYRRIGQSKAVAWDLTKEYVEAQISMLFHSPLTDLDITVSAWREGVELGTAHMHTDVSGDDEGRRYIFECADEYDMTAEAVSEAKAKLEALTA